jgi:cytochrome c
MRRLLTLAVLVVVLVVLSNTAFARYNPKYDKYVTKEDMSNFVKEAVAFAKIYGKETALREYMDKKGLFNRGELYIYAYDLNCIVLSHGASPNLIGRDLSMLQDTNGTRIIKNMVNKIIKDGKGWLRFYWFHPKTKMITPKLGYFEKVENDWWLGSGIYTNAQ